MDKYLEEQIVKVNRILALNQQDNIVYLLDINETNRVSINDSYGKFPGYTVYANSAFTWPHSNGRKMDMLLLMKNKGEELHD